MRPQGVRQRPRQSNGLQDEALQLTEDRGVGIGTIMLLIANSLSRDETAAFQALQFAFNGSGPGIDGPHNLGGVKASIRLTEDESKHALLYVRE